MKSQIKKELRRATIEASQIEGSINGNSLSNSFVGFCGRLNGDVTIPANSLEKIPIGAWNTTKDNQDTGRRDAWNDGITNTNGVVNSEFSLPSGYYHVSIMARVQGYDTTNKNLILFFSTNGSSFSGNVRESYPQAWQNGHVLADDSFTMSLNVVLKLTETSTDCAFMAQATGADTTGATIDRRSWCSVTKLRDI